MKRLLLATAFLGLCTWACGQDYRHFDFLGAGHTKEITVTTSSASNNGGGQKTVDGFPVQNDLQLKDASRFLAQCTFGADMATIQMAAAMGYEAWLDEQFALPLISTTDVFDRSQTEEKGAFGFRMIWLNNNLMSPDLLRQRLAFVWSEIMVINTSTDLFEDFGVLSSVYYDSLASNAYKNYRKLLMDVTLSPSMGLFLSHYNNPKANPELNTQPDENYAREIMQLFSIGLWELNPDGTRKYDANGQFIPTYSNDDIDEFAEVFTGLGDGRSNGEFGFVSEDFDDGLLNFRLPMRMYEDYHDTSSKQLLNGLVLPAGQTGMQDVSQTIDHLSNHPNTAPFISQSLIKFLTTSNPSPAYVKRVADVFKPHEAENFKDVLKAILLDPEARNCNRTDTYTFGKLREPLVRWMHFLKAFHLSQPEGFYNYEFFTLNNNIGQSPLQAPSVFNFFLPDYAPPGGISQRYLVAPEFQILNSTNCIGLVNEVDHNAVDRFLLFEFDYDIEEAGEELPEDNGRPNREGFEYNLFMDFSAEETLVNDPDQLINRLDIILANGLLTEGTKSIIKNAIQQLDNTDDKLRMAMYLILISPDYAILK
ncbi:MAG: DUF1800 family protein [Bacteroidota bacterium]